MAPQTLTVGTLPAKNKGLKCASGSQLELLLFYFKIATATSSCRKSPFPAQPNPVTSGTPFHLETSWFSHFLCPFIAKVRCSSNVCDFLTCKGKKYSELSKLKREPNYSYFTLE